MSLHPQAVPPVPQSTARAARAAFRRGNVYMRMRDEFGALYTDESFAPLFPTRGQSAEAPWRLALVTIMQFAEGLSDRQAADAVRGRIDWKYSLSLELDDAGFDASVLSEFRTRLVSGSLEQQMLDLLLEHFQARGLLKAGANSAATRRTCWRLSASSTASSWWARRCARPSTASPWSPPTGCAPGPIPSGPSATAPAPMISPLHSSRRSAVRSPGRSAWTGKIGRASC